MTEIAILGAGMAGFGAAHHLHAAGARSTVYEKGDHYGGHTSSYHFDEGFVFGGTSPSPRTSASNSCWRRT